MRKIITSSVLILLFSLFSGSVFAGKIEACENIKHDPAYKGLYGLCNAYWNANENAQDKILAKFEKKAGPDGPGMPGLDDTVPEPVACPCWVDGELDFPVTYSWFAFDYSASAPSLALYEFGSVQYIVDVNFCAYANQMGGFEAMVAFTTTDEEDEACVQDIVDLIARDF